MSDLRSLIHTTELKRVDIAEDVLHNALQEWEEARGRLMQKLQKIHEHRKELDQSYASVEAEIERVAFEIERIVAAIDKQRDGLGLHGMFLEQLEEVQILVGQVIEQKKALRR